LAGTLADTQSRLDLIVERLDASEEVSTTWQARYEDSERSLREAINSAKWLRTRNEDLERRLNSHQPEIKCALDAREAAFRRLKHARKVIRDLLEERVSSDFLFL
jgi:chromosome segregation ATPase